MIQILITGATGFIGKNLTIQLNRVGYEIKTPQIDVTQPKELVQFFKNQKPEIVIHLAAISHVPTCDQDPKLAFDVNLNGTIHLARALTEHSPQSILIFSSSSQVYEIKSGKHLNHNGAPLTENSRIAPQNTYAETKWLAEKALEYYRDNHNLNSIVLRLFNHTHSTQSPQFFLPGVYQKLLQAKGMTDPEISLGNLDLWRDFGSAQDLLRAFVQVIRKCEAKTQIQGHTFNICSGTAKSLKLLVDNLATYLHIPIRIKVDPARIRQNEPYSILGDPSLFSSTFDWAPSARSESDLIRSFLEPCEI